MPSLAGKVRGLGDLPLRFHFIALDPSLKLFHCFFMPSLLLSGWSTHFSFFLTLKFLDGGQLIFIFFCPYLPLDSNFGGQQKKAT